ncbi:hypothetical protein ACTA71_003768 [Dictyostelium dimigraforme]
MVVIIKNFLTKLILFILLFSNLNNNNSLFVNGVLEKSEHSALISLLKKANLLDNNFQIDSTFGQYEFCGGSKNKTYIEINCEITKTYVTQIKMECNNTQTQILASDFANKFSQLYSEQVFSLIISKCTMELGFLGNFPQKTTERVYQIKLNSCENSIEGVTGAMPFSEIYLFFNKAISATIDLGNLRGSFYMKNYNDAITYPHSINYTNSRTTYTDSVGELSIFASQYPTIGSFLDVSSLTIYLSSNYDRSSISNVLAYELVNYLYIYEDTSIKSFSLIPPIDKLVNKSNTQIFEFKGNFYTDRLLDYSNFTNLVSIRIVINNNYKNFSAPGNKFPLSGLPPKLATGLGGFFELNGAGGVFSTTSDFAVFKNTASIFSLKFNAISGPLPSWDKTIKSITSLDFSINNLTGTLDDSFCSIQSFKFDTNHLTGEIPSCMKCYMQNTPGSITIKGNSFTNNNNNEACTSIIPSYLIVNDTGSYLFGKDLGFNTSYVTSTPPAKWDVNTPSSVLFTIYKFQANTLVNITFSIIDKVLTVPVNISAPVFDSIEAKTNEKIIFNGSYFTYNASDIEITLYKKGQSYSCPVIQGDSTFSSISCNITNFSQLKDESNVKAIIRIGIYTNQLSINFGIINGPISMCSDNQCNERSYCLTNNATCTCNYGYTGLPDCTTPHYDCLNDCSSSNGGGTCNYSTGVCNCNQYRDGNDCSSILCKNDCFNGGTCNTKIGQCECVGNYIGDDCLSINCESDCLNGGSCDVTIGKCECHGNYQGNDCSMPYMECLSNCLNGGSCNNVTGQCKCSEDYQGSNCSIPFIDCPNNCLNGGICNNEIGQCECGGDYQSSDCSIPFIECKNVCEGNTRCNNQTGQCINVCPTQCYNQGKCDQETGICKCPTIEFIGIDCSIPNHWVSSINETSNTGGEVTLYGWFGDLHNNLSVLIGQLNCDNPVAIDSKTIKCQLPSGQSGIKNVNITQNEIIWIGKDLYHYLDNDSNKENNCLNNCNNRGICLSSGECRCNDGWKGLDCNSLGSSDSTNTDVDNNGKTTINDNYNNYEIFIDKLIELDFNGQQVKVYDLNKKWEKVINDTNNNSIQSFNQKLDNNQGELVYKVEIIDQTKDYSFSDLTYRLEKGSIKISMFINNYTYSNTLNTLQLQMITTTENIENKGNECNQKDTEIESNSNQLLNFVTIKKDNKVLYGRFINKVISDGRSTHLKTSVISSDQIKSTVTMGMDLPHCRNCIIDPDFSLLLTSNFKDSCGDDDNRKSYVIPVAVVASVAGVAAIGASVAKGYIRVTKRAKTDVAAKLIQGEVTNSDSAIVTLPSPVPEDQHQPIDPGEIGQTPVEEPIGQPTKLSLNKTTNTKYNSPTKIKGGITNNNKNVVINVTGGSCNLYL